MGSIFVLLQHQYRVFHPSQHLAVLNRAILHPVNIIQTQGEVSTSNTSPVLAAWLRPVSYVQDQLRI